MALRERKKKRTRQVLSETGLRMFLDQGFDDTTVDAIAEAAGVSRRTVFRYFDTKEAIFFANHEERLGHFREILARRNPGESAHGAVRRALLALSEVYMAERATALAQHRIVAQARHLAAYDQQLDEAWEEVIRRTLEEETGPTVAMMQAGMIIGIVRALLRHWFRGGCKDDLRALGEQALEVLADGWSASGAGDDEVMA